MRCGMSPDAARGNGVLRGYPREREVICGYFAIYRALLRVIANSTAAGHWRWVLKGSQRDEETAPA
jgi:hypothetical protein